MGSTEHNDMYWKWNHSFEGQILKEIFKDPFEDESFLNIFTDDLDTKKYMY